MASYPFDPRRFHWNPGHPHSSGSFSPVGRLKTHGQPLKKNPQAWDSRKTVSGRIIVGFNVGTEPKWSMDDCIKLVERVRNAQTGNPSSTFVAQKGIYKHQDPEHGVVHEDGAQIFIINEDASEADFEAQMVELAETLADEFEQELVIVEIQVNGISQHTIGVAPHEL